MSTTTKTYDTTYKKKVELDRDCYLPRQTPKGIIQCTGCGAFYFRRHWTLNPPSGFSNPVHSHPVYCPTCMKIKDRYPSGESYTYSKLSRRNGVRSCVYCATKRSARGRRIRLKESWPTHGEPGGWKVETTTEKLAQRLGRSLRKARGGKIAYKWGHNNKFVRVVWEKRAE
jgi:hypothetical protein